MQIFQVVCVVSDLEQTLDNWKQLVEFDESSIKRENQDPGRRCFYRGQEIDCPLRSARFDLGGVDVKLVQPLNDSGDPYSDCLREKGPGFHHLGIYVPDRAAREAAWQAQGMRPVYEEMGPDGCWALYDFDGVTGMPAVLRDAMTGPLGPRDSRGKTL